MPMSPLVVKRLSIGFFLLFFTALTFLVSGNAFFWDTVQLGSKQGHWFYDNSFRSLLLPDMIDSGHPPVFGIYLAAMWKIFGRSLAVSHFAMLPFLFLFVFQLCRLASRFFRAQHLFIAMALVVADPTLLAQSVLVSPDIVLVAFLLLALNALLDNQNGLLSISLTGLGLISMRGMFCVAVLFIAGNLIRKPGNTRQLARTLYPYLPVGLIVIAFLAWHYLQKGWIGYHAGSPWAACFEIVDVKGFIKNLGILAWRLADFGRLGLWLAALFLLIKSRRLFTDANGRVLFLVFAVSIAVLSGTLIFYRNLLAHRYLLPVFIFFTLWVAYLLLENNIVRHKKAWIAGIFLMLCSGHFWVYPDHVAKGWDSSLAHMPYYELRKEMLRYIRKENIMLSDISSEFPNAAKLRYTDLSDEEESFCEKDLTCRYVLYSNIFNAFTDEDIALLSSRWTLLKEARKGQVYFRLYKNPGLPDSE